jgi:hypothetical protein
VRRLNHFEQGAIGLALAGTLAAGCSSAATTPNQPSSRASSSSAPSPKFIGPTASSEACGSEAARQASSGSMRYTYESTNGASQTLASLQKEIGTATVGLAIHNAFVVRIGGVACTVRLGIPKAPDARQQAIIFTGNSDEAPSIYAQLGIPGQSNDKTSTTYYQVTRGTDGALAASNPSISVIGQETSGPSAFQNAGTEFCQGLEVDDPQTTSTTTYAVAKEAVCNDLGIGADSRQLGMSYAQYEQRLSSTGDTLTGPASHGLVVQMPELTQSEYDTLPAAV